MTALRRHASRRRRGNILVLTAVMMVVLFGLVAFSVDLGMAMVNRTEMQRSADAAAIAAVNELLDQQMLDPMGMQSEAAARQTAVQFAWLNAVGAESPHVPSSDVEIGVMLDRTDRNSPIIPGSGLSNAARVKVKRTADVNGETPYFFAPVFGHSGVAQEVQATAAYLSAFRGFAVASHGGNLGILPFALDNDTWEDLQNKLTRDDWTWDPETKTISPGADGILEVNLFPQDIGAPGNRGTVDIGHGGNSNADIKRQILEGISPQDLEYHGGKLEFDSNGELHLNGDTGISAAVKAQLESIKGEPRIIPIFESASGNGNNTNYTITKFVGIRVMEVHLTGKMSKKRVIVQPAAVRTLGGIPGDEVAPATFFIFSPATLLH